MPTVSEPMDEGLRRGKTASVLEYYRLGMLGEATTEASLRILRYEPEDIRRLMHEWNPRRAR